jgi:DNA polymerase V
MRTEVYRQTGIPVSVGIAETKTLAKVANHLAKVAKAKGVLDLTLHIRLRA